MLSKYAKYGEEGDETEATDIEEKTVAVIMDVLGTLFSVVEFHLRLEHISPKIFSPKHILNDVMKFILNTSARYNKLRDAGTNIFPGFWPVFFWF